MHEGMHTHMHTHALFTSLGKEVPWLLHTHAVLGVHWYLWSNAYPPREQTPPTACRHMVPRVSMAKVARQLWFLQQPRC